MENPYFQNLSSTTLDDFLYSQHPFLQAVDGWSRILGLLLFRLEFHQRAVILENLNDEHGHGHLEEAHVNTFKNFLKSIDQHPEMPLPTNEDGQVAVDLFLQNLKDLVEEEPLDYVFSALGMIEYTYLTVSNLLHQYVKEKLQSEDVDHYSTHELVDIKHSQQLFSLATEIDEDGLTYGYQLLWNLYDGLFCSIKTT